MTPSYSLDGSWRLRFERRNEAFSYNWEQKVWEGQEIRLPGSIQTAGLGDPVTVSTAWTGSIVDETFYQDPANEPFRRDGDVHFPFWLTPETAYTGPAWYQREIEILPEWAGKRVVLSLERAHWETRVWLDGVDLGSRNSLSVAHEYEFPRDLAPGVHLLTIRVDNRYLIDIGVNSHAVTDHTQGNWNGLIGRLELRAGEWTWIDSLRVFADPSSGQVRFAGQLAGDNTAGREIRFSVEDAPGNAVATAVARTDADGGYEAEAVVAGAEAWDEFHQPLYRVVAECEGAGRAETRFGFREIRAEGRHLILNDRRISLRGTLDCCVFPNTGHPPMDVASWRRIFDVVRGHGMNHVRYHSWCPPEAAFQAADEAGVYLQVECPSWPNQGTSIGDGRTLDGWLFEEAARILDAYGNHPSFVLMALGNETSGAGQFEYMRSWIEAQRDYDPRRLYTGGSGHPISPDGEFDISPFPRIFRGWNDGMTNRLHAAAPETVTDYSDYAATRNKPVIVHEIGQWCAYPDFDEIPKYQGHLRPRNFQIFQERLRRQGLLELGRDFLMATGHLQVLCIKEEIESNLRTGEFSGFHLLGLQDFPGQGTSVSGLMDAFWEPKPYVSADDIRKFCDETVLLARIPRRILTTGERLDIDIDIYHYGPADFEAVDLDWWLEAPDGSATQKGTLPCTHVSTGGLHRAGRIEVDAKATSGKYVLKTRLSGTRFANDWSLWIYEPGTALADDGVLVTTEFSGEACERLRQGGSVLLTVDSTRVSPDPKHGQIGVAWCPPFWNTLWLLEQPPHTMGVLCDPGHPALAGFPTGPGSDWNWWFPMQGAGALVMDLLPVAVEPIVRLIDDYHKARSLALMIEARVGAGRLIVCGTDLATSTDPVRRQLKKSLLAYMRSDSFQPTSALTPENVRSLLQ